MSLKDQQLELCKQLENQPRLIKRILDALTVDYTDKPAKGYFQVKCPVCKQHPKSCDIYGMIRYTNCTRGEGVFWLCYQDKAHHNECHRSFVGYIRATRQDGHPNETIEWIKGVIDKSQAEQQVKVEPPKVEEPQTQPTPKYRHFCKSCNRESTKREPPEARTLRCPQCDTGEYIHLFDIVSVYCSECQQPYAVHKTRLDASGKCPHCGEAVTHTDKPF